jgi:membrane dipeptidase
MGLPKTLDRISHLHAEIEESPGLFRTCRTCTEAKQAKEEGEIGLFLSLEGADSLQNDLG